MALFPLIDLPSGDGGEAANSLPLYREIKWDYANDRPVWQAGAPVYVSGAQAVEVWAWNTLHTLRGRSDIFTAGYGVDLDALTGQAYTKAIKESEAARIISDALMVNPYINNVRVATSFAGSCLTVSCAISTIYGEVYINGLQL